MNGCRSWQRVAGLLLSVVMAGAGTGRTVWAQTNDAAELKLFQGAWMVVKLIENGRVIPAEKIPELLPSGGRIEVVDKSILFMDARTGQRHARSFSVNAATYPSTIDISSVDSPDIHRGIYRFDQGPLIVCIGDPDSDMRPTELSAPSGSRSMLMVLQRRTAAPADTAKSQPPRSAAPAASSGTAAAPASAVPDDQQLRKSLVGVWRVPDQLGFLHIRFRDNGTFSSWRVHEELQLFRRVFVESPVSNGSWEVRDGRVLGNIGGSTDPGRVGSSLLFTIRGMTATEFLFVDGLGRSNRAVREAPASR